MNTQKDSQIGKKIAIHNGTKIHLRILHPMHHLMHRPQVNKVYKSVGVGVLAGALATITLTFIQQADFNF